jgi:hypothetical protein
VVVEMEVVEMAGAAVQVEMGGVVAVMEEGEEERNPFLPRALVATDIWEKYLPCWRSFAARA